MCKLILVKRREKKTQFMVDIALRMKLEKKPQPQRIRKCMEKCWLQTIVRDKESERERKNKRYFGRAIAIAIAKRWKLVTVET